MAPYKLLKGSLETIILSILKYEGPMHGYAITDKIKLLTNRKILINSSSLYLLLHKLQKEKILVSVSSLANNRLRVIYSLTPKGQNLIKQKSGEILDFIQSLKPFLKN